MKNGGASGAGSGAMGVEALLGEERPAVLKAVDLDEVAAVVTNAMGEILMVNQVRHHIHTPILTQDYICLGGIRS